MSLRIAPPSSHPTTTKSHPSAPSAPGLPDTLRTLSSAPITTSDASGPAAVQSSHPLESRLANWNATQAALKSTLLRRQFGVAAPVIRSMELMTVAHGDSVRPSALGRGAGVHEDILRGTDAEISWEDVFVGDEFQNPADFHSEMEQRMGMNF